MRSHLNPVPVRYHIFRELKKRKKNNQVKQKKIFTHNIRGKNVGIISAHGLNYNGLCHQKISSHWVLSGNFPEANDWRFIIFIPNAVRVLETFSLVWGGQSILVKLRKFGQLGSLLAFIIYVYIIFSPFTSANIPSFQTRFELQCKALSISNSNRTGWELFTWECLKTFQPKLNHLEFSVRKNSMTLILFD